MVEFQGQRKTIPQGDRGSRVSENGTSSHPQVKMESFSLDRPEDNRLLPSTSFELPRPLTQFQRTSVAGGRVFGGGTSREALRRAKRTIKSQPI